MSIYFLLVTVVSAQVIIPDEPIVVSDFVNCINELIDTNFAKCGVLILPHSYNASPEVVKIRAHILEKIHHSHKYTVEVTGPDSEAICNNDPGKELKVLKRDPFKIMFRASYFVIIVDNYNDFTYLTTKIIRFRFWNPYAKFIVFLYHTDKNDYEIRGAIEDILNCLYKFNVINIIVIVPQTQILRNALIYSWKPYDPPEYCGYHNQSAKNRLIIENVCEKGILKSKETMFKDKVPSNMHGCEISVLAIERQPFVSRKRHDPNIEGQFITEMFGELNFSVSFNIINKFRGERNENGIWDGALKDLVERKGELLLGGIFPDYDVHEDFECSTSYLSDSYTWVVPRANLSPTWRSVHAAFDKIVWYLGGVVFIVCVFTWKILGQLSGDTKYNKMFIHCFLNTWIVLLGFPAYMLPKKQSLRIFFGVLNIYCILFVTAYQTKMIDILRNPSYGYQIKSIQELVKSDFKYGGLEELHGLFYNSSDPFDSLIGDKWINVNNMSKALLDVVVHRNFSVLCSRLQLAYLSTILPQLSDSFGRKNYYAFDRRAFFVPLEMIALKGFPFIEKISEVLILHKQMGMNEIVKRRFNRLYAKKREKFSVSSKYRKNLISPLSVQHLESGFFVLGLGFCGGTIILIIEIVFYIRHRVGVRHRV